MEWTKVRVACTLAQLDTVGAVAGSLAGALYGFGDIPKEWLEVIKRKEYLEELAVNAARAWDK